MLKPSELPEALQDDPPDPRRYEYIRDELRAYETERRLRALRHFTVAVFILCMVLAMAGAWRTFS